MLKLRLTQVYYFTSFHKRPITSTQKRPSMFCHGDDKHESADHHHVNVDPVHALSQVRAAFTAHQPWVVQVFVIWRSKSSFHQKMSVVVAIVAVCRFQQQGHVIKLVVRSACRESTWAAPLFMSVILGVPPRWLCQLWCNSWLQCMCP